MRFVLDQDVDANLVRVLVSAGHQAWTVASAGIPDAADDDISVYAADKNAIEPFDDVFVYLSKEGLSTHLKWR